MANDAELDRERLVDVVEQVGVCLVALIEVACRGANESSQHDARRTFKALGERIVEFIEPTEEEEI